MMNPMNFYVVTKPTVKFHDLHTRLQEMMFNEVINSTTHRLIFLSSNQTQFVVFTSASFITKHLQGNFNFLKC